MNPILSAALGSLIRWVLALAAGVFVQHGVWTSSDASTYVAAATLGLLSLGWSLWNKYKGRIRFLTALALPHGATEGDVKDHITSGFPTPSVSTSPDSVPKLHR